MIGSAATIAAVLAIFWFVDPFWLSASMAGLVILGAYAFLLGGAVRETREARRIASQAVERAAAADERSEQEIEKRSSAERSLELLHSIHQAIAESSGLEEATSRILKAICQTLGWSMGAMWRPDRSGAHLNCLQVWHVDSRALGEFADSTKGWQFAPRKGLPGQVWAEGKPVWVPNVLEGKNFPRAPFADRAGLHGAFAFPLRSGAETIGVMEFFSPRIEEPQPRLMNILDSISFQVGQYLERARIEEAIRESEARKSAILESAFDPIITVDEEGVIREFNPAAEGVFGYSKEEALGQRIDDLLVVPNLSKEFLRMVEEFDAGDRSPLSERLEVPVMRSDGSPLIIEVAVSRVHAGEDLLYTGFVRDVTEARLAEEAERFLADVNEILISSLDYRATLSKAAERTAGYLADHCFIDRLEGPNSISRVAQASAADPEVDLVRSFDAYLKDLRSHHPTLHALRSGEKKVLTTMPERALRSLAPDEPTLEGLRGAGLGSMAVLPLVVRNRVLGALTLVTTNGRRLDHRQLEVAEELARRVAVALENALLHEDRSRVARTLQRSLIPPRLPDIDGLELAARYRPAGRRREVGGDFYDVFPYGQRRWAFVIGDVAGKGATAASLTALVRYTVRSEAMQEREPSAVVASVNEALVGQSRDEQFSSLVYGRVDRTDDAFVLTLVCAGHPSPYLVRTDGSVVPIGVHGTLLGIQPSVEVPEQMVTLAAQDTVVFYTDGLSEARSDGAIFGDERLEAVLSESCGEDAETIADRLENAVSEFCDEDFVDDVAFLVVRVAG